MDIQAIQDALREIATEASRFGAEQALGIKTDTDQYVTDEKVTEAMRKAVHLIITEHNLSLGPIHTERVN